MNNYFGIKTQVIARIIFCLFLLFGISIFIKRFIDMPINDDNMPYLIGSIMGSALTLLYFFYMLANCILQCRGKSIRFKSTYKIGFIFSVVILYQIILKYISFGFQLEVAMLLLSFFLLCYLLVVDGIVFYKSKKNPRNFSLRGYN